ncbi:hypothetical protein C8R44DRAFT_980504 [Mycena epipterygia]|nr:hypothetical protein C8R44DRAFT_980504 [Mycena epipterygia]
MSAAPFTYPRYIVGLPRDATHLALNETAFLLLPAHQYSIYNVVPNDKRPAQSCVSTDTVLIALSGDANATKICTSQNSTSDGQQVGTRHYRADAFCGTTSSTTNTVTSALPVHTILIPILSCVSCRGILRRGGRLCRRQHSVPAIAEVTSTFSFTGTFMNTLSIASTAKSDQTSSETLTQTSAAGKMCHLQFTTQTCILSGTSQLVTSWVWFEALSIDSTLTNQDDRSTFIQFSNTTGTTSTSNYSGVCS